MGTATDRDSGSTLHIIPVLLQQGLEAGRVAEGVKESCCSEHPLPLPVHQRFETRIISDGSQQEMVFQNIGWKPGGNVQ